MNDDLDLVKGSEEAYRQVRQAQLDRSRAAEKTAAEYSAESPDNEAAMEKLFENGSRSQNPPSDEDIHRRAAQDRAAYVKSQRDYFEDRSNAMSMQGIIDRGGAKIGKEIKVSDGLAGMLAAGGERKGRVVGMGMNDILAAGGQKIGPELKIGASFGEQLAAVRWGANMQALRTAGRQYQSLPKKKNDGGLTAARQSPGAKNFFPNRPIFTVGPVMFTTMKHDGAVPLVGTWTAAEDGWPTIGVNNSINNQRGMKRAGRAYYG